MLTQISKIDKQGRIELPDKMRKECGLLPETDVLIELKDDGIFIKPKLTTTPITQRIAEMDLPVSDWKEIEKEIAEGHLK
ncbi:MAG: AbrB/MazE/SpoVT family DNA-binding domain-containing protein [bacterium]